MLPEQFTLEQARDYVRYLLDITNSKGEPRKVPTDKATYESDRTLNHHHYWTDPDKRVELQITFK